MEVPRFRRLTRNFRQSNGARRCDVVLHRADNCVFANLMKRWRRDIGQMGTDLEPGGLGKAGETGMYFPQFLVGMSATTVVVAIWAYIEAGSIWTALGWAILALVILQVGYFGLVVRLIFRRSSEAADARAAPVDRRSPLAFWDF